MHVVRIVAEVVITVDSGFPVNLSRAAGRGEGQVVPLEAQQAAGAVGVVVAVALAHAARRFFALSAHPVKRRQRLVGVQVGHETAAPRLVRGRLGTASGGRQSTSRTVSASLSACGVGDGGAFAARGHDRRDAEARDGGHLALFAGDHQVDVAVGNRTVITLEHKRASCTLTTPKATARHSGYFYVFM